MGRVPQINAWTRAIDNRIDVHGQGFLPARPYHRRETILVFVNGQYPPGGDGQDTVPQEIIDQIRYPLRHTVAVDIPDRAEMAQELGSLAESPAMPERGDDGTSRIEHALPRD